MAAALTKGSVNKNASLLGVAWRDLFDEMGPGHMPTHGCSGKPFHLVPCGDTGGNMAAAVTRGESLNFMQFI